MFNYSSYSVFLDYNAVRGISWAMAVIGVPCNIFVIIRFILLNCRYPKKILTQTLHSHYQSRFSIRHNPSVFLLFNLTLTDSIGSLYVFILVIGDVAYTNYYQNLYGSVSNYSVIRNDWVISPACTTARILSQLALLMSTLMTFMVAVDRFILVIFPHSRRKITMKNAYIVSIVYWIFAFIIAMTAGILSSQGVVLQSSTKFDIIDQLCTLDSSKSVFVLAIAYIELLLGFGLHITSTILYILIYRKLKQSQRLFSTISSNRAEKRVSIILSAIVLTNIFTYLPVMLITILGQAIPDYDLKDSQIFPIMVMLLYVNTTINPILFIALCAEVGSSNRQVGQSRDCNTLADRSNVTQQ